MTNSKTAHEQAFILKLSSEQEAWLNKAGIGFCGGSSYNRYTHSITGFYVEVYQRGGNTFYVSREPTCAEEGEDCNDGEPVALREFLSLREALRHLAWRRSDER